MAALFTQLHPDLLWLANVIGRLFLALVLGGLVGYEREHAKRPAGFRTHILVSVGAALVMILAEFLRRAYPQDIDLDPTRLGAQVITGIGFLGAGTIIRNGSSVRGLTTAASIWVVGCIGLACGGGFYAGALVATALTYLTLITLKQLEKKLSRRMGNIMLDVILTHYSQDISSILQRVKETGVAIRQIQIYPEDPEDETTTSIRLQVGLAKIDEQKRSDLVVEIKSFETVRSVAIQ
jgi:putative Mg2+ transporter-C (MgtC) family protein